MNDFNKYDAILGTNYSTALTNNTVARRLGADKIGIELHGNTILVFDRYGWVEYDSCGSRTKTTKDRMNAYGPYRVFALNGTWYVIVAKEKLEFVDGMKLNPMLAKADPKTLIPPIPTPRAKTVAERIGQYIQPDWSQVAASRPAVQDKVKIMSVGELQTLWDTSCSINPDVAAFHRWLHPDAANRVYFA